jgi:hypothetical protein
MQVVVPRCGAARGGRRTCKCKSNTFTKGFEHAVQYYQVGRPVYASASLTLRRPCNYPGNYFQVLLLFWMTSQPTPSRLIINPGHGNRRLWLFVAFVMLV